MARGEPKKRSRNPKGTGQRLHGELLEAANRLLDESADPAAVTIRGVAAAVGVAPNAVYLHFTSRQDLLVALVGDRFAAFADHIAAAADAAGDDPLERFRHGNAAYIGYALDHPGHYRLMFGDAAGKEALRYGLEAFELCVTMCRRLVDAGLVGDADPTTLASAMWAFDHGYVELARTMRGSILPSPLAAIDAFLAAMTRP